MIGTPLSDDRSDALRQLHLQFELQADAVSGTGAAAVFVPHGQSQDRRAEAPEYLAVNRWGVVPSLRHRGLTILQSNVILDYLARDTGHFEGKTEQQAGRRANGCRGRPTTSPRSPGCATRRGSASLARRGHRRVPPARRGGAVVCRQDAEGSGVARRRRVHASPISAAGGAWCSWPRAGSTSPTGRISKPGRARLKAMPGFALPYDLIPSKDREFDPS